MPPVLLAAALAFTPADAHLAYETAGRLVARHTPRDAGTVRGSVAAHFILDAANSTGIDARLDRFTAKTPRGTRTLVNVEGVYRSDPDAPWIVLVSHYDTKPGVDCPGANDGASTTGLLVAIANALYDRRPGGYNVLLVWTDGEECESSYAGEDGLHGSRRAAARLAERELDVRAVVCLDMLGDRDLNVTIPRNATAHLRKAVLRQAKAVGLADAVKAGGEAVWDDHVPFLDAGFPAVDIIDFDYGGDPGENLWWHTPEDTMDKISEESLLAAGRLVASLLESLATGRAATCAE